jgi:hypothetical protein
MKEWNRKSSVRAARVRMRELECESESETHSVLPYESEIHMSWATG